MQVFNLVLDSQILQ